jgi:phosphomannomutase
MSRLRQSPPARLAGFDVTTTDLMSENGQRRTDALIMSGGDGETTLRIVVRPSGTEPKLKSYIEVRCGDVSDLGEARARAKRLQDVLAGVAARF